MKNSITRSLLVLVLTSGAIFLLAENSVNNDSLINKDLKFSSEEFNSNISSYEVGTEVDIATACNGGLRYEGVKNGKHSWVGLRAGTGVKLRVSNTNCKGKELSRTSYLYIQKGRRLLLTDCQRIICGG